MAHFFFKKKLISSSIEEYEPASGLQLEGHVGIQFCRQG